MKTTIITTLFALLALPLVASAQWHFHGHEQHNHPGGNIYHTTHGTVINHPKHPDPYGDENTHPQDPVKHPASMACGHPRDHHSHYWFGTTCIQNNTEHSIKINYGWGHHPHEWNTWTLDSGENRAFSHKLTGTRSPGHKKKVPIVQFLFNTGFVESHDDSRYFKTHRGRTIDGDTCRGSQQYRIEIVKGKKALVNPYGNAMRGSTTPY
jgi:hypothetical protein